MFKLWIKYLATSKNKFKIKSLHINNGKRGLEVLCRLAKQLSVNPKQTPIWGFSRWTQVTWANLYFPHFAHWKFNLYILRNGILLCDLLNSLIPDSIDLSKVNKLASTSRFMCAHNLSLFREACKSHFDLNESDLFDPESVLEYDLTGLLKTLSCISKSSTSLSKGYKSFIVSDSLHNNMTYNTYSNDMLEIEQMYTPAAFFLENVTKNQQETDYLVYEHYKPIESKINLKKINLISSKKSDYIIREVLVTEETYVNVLRSLQYDYIVPLSKVLNCETAQIIAINIEVLYKFHDLFYSKLLEACEGGKGIFILLIPKCVFNSVYKFGFMKLKAEPNVYAITFVSLKSILLRNTVFILKMWIRHSPKLPSCCVRKKRNDAAAMPRQRSGSSSATFRTNMETFFAWTTCW